MRNDPRLILKRAPIGDNQEDYNVLENGVVVGRFFLVPVAPKGTPRGHVFDLSGVNTTFGLAPDIERDEEKRDQRNSDFGSREWDARHDHPTPTERPAY
jgi:hypothetical protein